MVQYEMYFTNEYVEEIIDDLIKAMKLDVKLDIKKEAIATAMQERDKSSPNNLLILKENANILCIDCNDKDWVFPLVVRCQEKYADAVKGCMLKWDNLIREEYDQALTEDIRDVYHEEKTLLSSIESYYGKTI